MQRLLILVLYSLLWTLVSSESVLQADCLQCWETVCDPDALTVEMCSCECVKYVEGAAMCQGDEYDKHFPDLNSCCEEANIYLNSEIHGLLTPINYSEGQCFSHYNQPPDQAVPRSDYTLLPTGRVFLFNAIEFECEGCIQSISLYLNRSTNAGDNTQFTLTVWHPNLLSSSDNSTVFVASSVTRSFDSQPMEWNNVYRAESTINGMLCFKPGDKLGVAINKSFAGKILRRPKHGADVTYMHPFSNCPDMNQVFFVQTAQESGVPLIDVTVVNSDTPTNLVSSSNLPSNPAPTLSLYSSTITRVEPMTPTLFTSNDIIHTSGPSSSSPSSTSSIYISVGIVGVVLIVALLCGTTLLVVFYVKRHCVGQVDVKDEPSVEMRPGQSLVRPGESRGSFNFAEEWHQDSPAMVHNAFDNNLDALDGSTHHYDDPNELNTVPPRGSQFSLNDHQYTCMEIPDSGAASNATSPSQTLSSPNYNPSHHCNRPPSRNDHYQSPRTPASSSMSSDYDSKMPAVLDKFSTSRQMSSATSDHPLTHVYQRLEDPSEQSPPIPPRSSSISKHDYHVLEEPGKEHFYHVMEKGFHVPGASDRLSWAHQNMQVSGANFNPQLFHRYRTNSFFDERDHYWEPADKPNHIYDQLKSNRCREIPLDSLEFDEEIGSGHFGVVFKGVWKISEEDTRAVAIKTLKPQAANDEQKSRLLKEGARMMQFFHSNVVTLHGMVTVGDMPMLIIEYMTNHDLITFLQHAKKKNNIPEPQLMLRFCRDIAAGMRHLAKKKYVHRDLAARNILLNESLVCKISDFGMTRDHIYRYKMDTAEHIPLRWTPLEAVNERKYSEKSDVYSYGMVMFEIWSLGQKPLTTMSDRDTIINFIQQGGVCFPPPGCPREIYRLMIRCWHPIPIRRPSFGDILEDFLSTSDESLLHWSTQDKHSSPKAFEIGANIKEGFNLYTDLQKIYREQ